MTALLSAGIMLEKQLALIAPLKHKNSGSETQENPDRANQVSTETKRNLTLYIPENFDIDDLLKKNPPNFKYHRDYFIYIVHLITDIPSRNKDENMFYVPLNSSLLQRRVREYRKYLDYLVEYGVLDENRQYIKGKKSRSFKFTNKYQTLIKPTTITKNTLINSILKFIDIEYSLNDDCLIEDTRNLSYLHSWFTGDLTIDFEAAKQYLLDLYEQEKREELNVWNEKIINAMARFNSRYIVLLKLHRQQFLHTVDNTAGRFHTVLTQLKGDLRQFIRYKDHKLVAVDIVNSQPYLSCVFFNKDKFIENEILLKVRLYNNSLDNKEKARKKLCKTIENAYKSKSVNNFIDIVKSGQLYGEFADLLLEKGIIEDDGNLRKQAKKIIFSSFFSPNQAIAYNDAMVIFKEQFPDVYEIYRAIKQGKHRTLACTLQNLEAELVLHKACKIISEKRPEIPLFTLHDAIITTEGNEEYVKEVLYDVLLNAIGIPPTLKLERWEMAA